jgi:hypothetical protein
MKLIATAAPRVDGLLSIVEATEDVVVLSNGHELQIRSARLAELCRQWCQDQEPIRVVRTWHRIDGEELVIATRLANGLTVETQPAASEVF